MTIEKDISDLKEAFRLYIELKKEDEVNYIMEKESYSDGSKFTVENRVDRKYEKIIELLRW